MEVRDVYTVKSLRSRRLLLFLPEHKAVDSWSIVLDFGPARTTERLSDFFTISKQNVCNGSSNREIGGEKVCGVSGSKRWNYNGSKSRSVEFVVNIENFLLVVSIKESRI